MSNIDDRIFDAVRRIVVDEDPTAAPSAVMDRTLRRLKGLRCVDSRSAERFLEARLAEVEGLRERYVQFELRKLSEALRRQQRAASDAARARAERENPGAGPNVHAAIASKAVVNANPHLFTVLDEEMRARAVEKVAKARPWLHPHLLSDPTSAAGSRAAASASAFRALSLEKQERAATRSADLDIACQALYRRNGGLPLLGQRIHTALIGLECPITIDHALELGKGLQGATMSECRRVLNECLFRRGEDRADAQTARYERALKALPKKKKKTARSKRRPEERTVRPSRRRLGASGSCHGIPPTAE